MIFQKLNTGADMPSVGLGTWKVAPDKAGNAVKYAIAEAGYRHIDCAWIYGNEPEIGAALEDVFKNTVVKREDVFVTSKLWNTFHPRESVVKACKESLSNLRLDYLDLYLMHWGIAIPAGTEGLKSPVGRNTEYLNERGVLITENIPVRETWEAMQDLIKEGLVKAIGVANFTTPMLVDLLTYAKVTPAVNQVELHPYLQQSKLTEFCGYHDIRMTAYSPLGSPGNYTGAGLPILSKDPSILALAEKHQKTATQILLRWGIQRGTAVIPKSIRQEHLKENIEIFDFQLSDEEMQAIAKLDRDFRFVEPYEWWGIPYFG